jgi:hypothetical protein
MSQAPKRIARGLSLLGAPIVAATAILLGAAAVEWIVKGFAGIGTMESVFDVWHLGAPSGSWQAVTIRAHPMSSAPT